MLPQLKLSLAKEEGSETLDMTYSALREIFEGDSADMCAGKFPLMSMVG
jgi:hypothetical protein